ncbi:MAG TPA: hypothetical protein VFX61_07510 [Micromonosporaceae bacterium]|nr:hypothetical protein [Micromonosporaceae bacterium]
MLKFFNALGDRLLSAFVPKVTVQAACTVWDEFCYCARDATYWRSCDRGCDSSMTNCGPCNIRRRYTC